MATLREFWARLLRAVGMRGQRAPRWVEPSNTVTRAIYEGRALVTMATWEDSQRTFVPAPPAPIEAAPEAPERAAGDEASPKRPGVAA